MEWNKVFNETEKHLTAMRLQSRTIKDYINRIKKFKEQVNKKPSDVKSQDFIDYILIQKSLPMRKNVYTALKRMAETCNFEFNLDASIYKEVSYNSVETKENVNPLEKKELNQKFSKIFEDANSGEDFKSVETMVLSSVGRSKIQSLLVLSCGLKVQEIIDLKIKDVDLDKGLIKTENRVAKINKNHLNIFRNYIENYNQEFDDERFFDQYFIPLPAFDEDGMLCQLSDKNLHHYFPIPYRRLFKHFLLNLIEEKESFDLIKESASKNEMIALFEDFYRKYIRK